ncbi:MAG: Rho termination factor N-terminal domain-containing protein [Spirochaetales bacterium]|nr:Rho termination factor N-terminal domain-containing protein [Spirochaetales bacterium]
MTVKEIKAIAKDHGVEPGKMKKDELILAIQTEEGNNPCFGSDANGCGQDSCLWRTDCLKLV